MSFVAGKNVCKGKPDDFCISPDNKKYTIFLDEKDFVTASESCDTLGIFYAESHQETSWLLDQVSIAEIH